MNTEKWKKHKLANLVFLAIINSIISSTSFADDLNELDLSNHNNQLQQPASSKDLTPVFYRGRLTAGPFYDTDVRYFGLYDLFMPYTVSSKTILFLDGRYKQNHGPTYEGNWGAGLRHIFGGQKLFGLYSFWDRRDSEYGNTFNQITVGTEVKSVRWSFMANGYIPVGKKDFATDALDFAALVPSGAFSNIVFRRGIEKAMYGADFLLGYLVPHTYGLGAYVGGFVYARDGVKTAAGPIVHMEYTIQRDNDKRIFGILSKIHLVSDYQHDDVRGSTWFAGVRLDILYGHQPELHGIQKRMQDFVRRDLNIFSEPNTEAPTSTLLNPDGTPVTVAQINTPFTTSAANVIGVTGAINNGGTTVALVSGQNISGGDYPFDGNGHAYHVQVGNNGSITSTVRTMSIPATSTGNTIENLSLTMTSNANTQNLACTGGVACQNNSLIIRNNTMLNTSSSAVAGTSNFAIIFGAGASSNITLANNTLTKNNAASSSFNIIINTQATSNSLNTVAMDGNTITNSSTGAGNGNVDFAIGSTNNAIEITSFQANNLSADQTNLRIFANNNGGTTTVSGPISNNIMTSAGNAASFIVNAGAGGAVTNTISISGSISNNTFNGGTVGTATQGVISFLADGTNNGNTVNVTGGFTNNTISVNNTLALTNGVVQVQQSGAQNVVNMSGFRDNTITTATGFQSPGIFLNSAAAGGSITINVNDGTNGLDAANGLAGATATNDAGGAGTLTVNPSI